MKKIFLPIVLVFTMMIVAASCDKLENNGDLAGNWQLQSMVSATDGDTICDKTSGIYYKVSRELFCITGRGAYYLSTFTHVGDSLFILPHPGAKAAGETFTDFSFLEKAGATPDGGFHIDNLDSQHLTLSNAKYVLTFRKY